MCIFDEYISFLLSTVTMLDFSFKYTLWNTVHRWRSVD